MIYITMLWHVLVVCDPEMQDEGIQPMYMIYPASRYFQLSMRMTLSDVHIHSTDHVLGCLLLMCSRAYHAPTRATHATIRYTYL